MPGPAYGVPGGKPDNYLVWALLSLLFCCLPTGIVSVVYAAKVDGPWSSGLYAEASAAAQTAKKWAIAGPTAAVVSGGTYTLLMLVLAAASESGNS